MVSVKRKESNRKYYQKNKEKIKSKNKEYRQNNKDKVNESKRRYTKHFPEKIKKYCKTWRENNPEKVINNSKNQYNKNKDRINKRSKIWKQINPEKVKISTKKWRDNNPEKTLQANIRHIKKYGKTFDMNPYEFLYALNNWSKTIKKLDNKMCKLCDSVQNLNAHHIQPKSGFPELCLDLYNGITLCKECHGELHGYKIYG